MWLVMLKCGCRGNGRQGVVGESGYWKSIRDHSREAGGDIDLAKIINC